MRFFIRALSLAVAAASLLAHAAPIATRSTEDLIAGRYIVQLKPDVDVASFTAHREQVRSIVARHLGLGRRNDIDLNAGIDQEYDLGDFKGYAGAFDPAVVAELEAMDDVFLVEKDFLMYPTALITQTNAPWGLASVSSRTRGATSYVYDSTAGNNTYSYVLDSGIRTTHVEFEGRASWGYNAANSNNADVSGHGTHVAGVIGSKTYGVAKKTNLVAVKVIGDDNVAAGSSVLAGLNWATNDIVTNSRLGSAVVNLSLGGPASSSMDNAVNSLANRGILPIVAAGNENQPAANVSPARAANALCVGSVQSNDARSSTSNYGSAVDIWAPGGDIMSTWHTSDTATLTASGTSASAPFVAGIVSYMRGLEGQSIGPVARARVLALGTPNRLTDVAGAPNLLAYNGRT
ncbi:subtilisin-like protease-like protein [Alternaria rosae]|uniref:subtilisin-like protease-like protein n=1 Tax=Alternaria rosae TaxID=1187941 RepID=UPI001E8DD63E|nr:subtilisin-like protease-like protein [Alternaria rosae]KAH6865475.1 subtilisin-like protease-like protein [Alternaria rosae]